MRLMMIGFSNWLALDDKRSESVRTIDTAITVTGTLLLAVTYVLLRG